MKKILLLSILLSTSAQAKVLTEKLNVIVINKNKAKNKNKPSYSILFKEKAALYQSSEKFIECFKYSIKRSKPVLVRWNIDNLEIIGCKTRKKAK